MKIADVRLTGLAGATVEGGWAIELEPQDNLHTIVEVVADDGRVGVGSAMTAAGPSSTLSAGSTSPCGTCSARSRTSR
jgi:L-alanine-DL-glutamate epimerase-like enolase superfamily enzyme